MKIIITKQQLEAALRLIKSDFDDVSDRIDSVEDSSVPSSELKQYLLDSINGLKSDPGQDKLSIDLSQADNSTSEFITISDVNDALSDTSSGIGQVIDEMKSDIDDVEGKLEGISGSVSDFVDSEISEAISGLNTVRMEIVDVLPNPQDADENVLYLLYNNDTRHYDIYAKINDELVWIDDTNATIDGYVSSLSTDITSGEISPDSQGNVYLELTPGVENLISEKLGSGITTDVETWVSDNFVQMESGKSLVSDSEIQKLQSVESNAEENVIEVIQQNGTDLPVTNKTVNVEIPVALSELTNDAEFVTGQEVQEIVEDSIEDAEISANQITGVLSVEQGGTGSSSFDDGVLVFDNGAIDSLDSSSFISTFEIQQAIKSDSFQINIEDWQVSGSTYVATIPVDGCTEADFPILSIDEDFINDFGISSQCESIQDGINVYSTIQPDCIISGTYVTLHINTSK